MFWLFPFCFHLGWRVSEEQFYGMSFSSNLKLRGSYGNIGNQSIEPYAVYSMVIGWWVVNRQAGQHWPPQL